MNNDNEDEGWKSFSNNTETGRLLRRLYGVQPVNDYPKIRRTKIKREKQESVNNEDWKIGKESKVTFNKSRAKSIKIPKVGGSRNKENDFSPIEFIPKRKNVSECLKQIDNHIMLKSNYRPPHENSIYSESEKKKLNEIFTFKGGRALPRELTHPEGSLPSEVKSMSNKMNNDEEMKKESNTKEELFNVIWNSIKERIRFHMDMEKTGFYDPTTRQKIECEIKSRCDQLRDIDADKANYLINKFI